MEEAFNQTCNIKFAGMFFCSLNSSNAKQLNTFTVNSKCWPKLRFCKQVRNVFEKLSQISPSIPNSKRKFFNLFNETSGKTLTTHHNKQIVENIETFNTFFANIGVELAKAFDPKQKYEIETNTNTMLCFPITSSDIIDTLRVLPLEFSLDCHNINYFLLKKISRAVSPLLETLYNECLKLGVFPQCLKIAKIVPFSKAVIVANPQITDQSHFLQPLANYLKNFYIKEFIRF